MLIDKVNYKASHLHKFIDEVCDFVKRQENDTKKQCVEQVIGVCTWTIVTCRNQKTRG